MRKLVIILEIERLQMMKRNQMFEPVLKIADPMEKVSLEDQQALAYLTLFNKKPKVLSNSFK